MNNFYYGVFKSRKEKIDCASNTRSKNSDIETLMDNTNDSQIKVKLIRAISYSSFTSNDPNQSNPSTKFLALKPFINL